LGSQSKLKAARRRMQQEHKEEIRKLHEQVESDPRFAEEMERHHTPESRAEVDRYFGQQVERLANAGWRRAEAGSDGLGIWDNRRRRLRFVHSVAVEDDGLVWAHISLSYADGNLPGWYDLREVHWLLYPRRYGYMVVAPKDKHFSVSEVMHVWVPLTGDPPLPDFRHMGLI
jgi:hypothetical protein